jgi:septum formation protein
VKLILASGSPRRRELLAGLGLEFTVQPSDVDEEAVVDQARPGHPEEIVTLLAEAKARAVARETRESALVIGADTIVWLDGQALNKPRDEDDAVRMLLLLAGRAHRVYTGIALVSAGDCVLRPAVTAFEMTDVEFHPMTESEARAYVATGEPMDKAGAYGIQDTSIGKKLVKAVRGDYYNVVGLPLELLRNQLRLHFPGLGAP